MAFMEDMTHLQTILMSVVIVAVLINGCTSSRIEKELARDLLSDYNSKARPVAKDSDVVNVTLDIALHHIMKVNEKSEVLTTNVWVKQYWNDPRLTWNKTRYHGIKQVIIEPKRLWLPDISLLNSATANMEVNGAEADIVLKHNGDIAWLNPAVLKSSCSINITYFPFDDQLCEIRLGSWSFTTPYVDITAARTDSADLSHYGENGEWILLGSNPLRLVKEYDCCEGWYPEVTYKIHLRRRTLYYIMNFILPCILIAVLTLLVFLLPPESGERMSFGVTVLLSFTILILMLMDKLPPTSKAIPLLGVYYACTIIEVSLAMFVACLMMRIYYPENSSAVLPGWAKVFIMNYCAKLVGLRMAAERVKQGLVIQLLQQAKLRDNQGKTTNNINILTESILKKEEAEGIREEWRISSVILNRLFALIYLVTIIITLLAVMLQAPRFKDGNL